MGSKQGVLVSALVLASFVGCSNDGSPRGSIELRREALTGVLFVGPNDGVLGLEDATKWTAANGVATASDLRTQGERSLAFRPQGYATLKSAKLAMTGAPKQVAFDFRLPKQQANPWWYGQVQLFVECPSRNVYNAYLGAKELTGLALEAWHTFSFDVPAYVVSALDGRSYDDLTLTIVVNAAAPAGEYLIDAIRLRGPTEVPLELRLVDDPTLGTPALVAAPDGQTIPLSVAPTSPSEAGSVALALFQSYRGSFRLVAPAEELVPVSVARDEGPFAVGGFSHVRLQQVLRGSPDVPIFGAEAVAHLTPDLRVVFVNGRTVPTPSVDATPAITPAEAEAAAKAALPTDELALRASLRLPSKPAVLGIYVPALFKKGNGPARLAYRTETLGYVTFVSAADGSVLLRWSSLETARDRTTYDYKGQSDFAQAEKVMTETSRCPAFSDTEICDLHRFLGDTYDYFKNQFGRDSDDGKGAAIVAGGNYLEYDAKGSVCPNAWASGPTFCDDTASQDVVAHEFAHRVTGNTSKLEYLDESGALNESFSDVMGMGIEGGEDLIGEDTTWNSSACGALRSMRAPEDCGQPWQYDDYRVIAGDGGGVHTNSGIPNHAAWLLMNGGERDGIRVNAIGVRKTELLEYFANAVLYTSTTDMYQAALLNVQACKAFAFWYKLLPTPFSPADCDEVVQAFVATRMLGRLRITSPATNANLGFGVFGTAASQFKADVRDPNDAGNTSRVDWGTSTGPLTGSNWYLGAPGRKTVFATVRFKNGLAAKAEVSFNLVNELPLPEITHPSATTPVYAGVPLTLRGTAVDANQLGFECSGLRWTSSIAADVGFPATGCDVTVTFATAGKRTVTLQATDSNGGKGTTSRVVDVLPVPTSGPPIVDILRPLDGQSFFSPPYAPLALELAGVAQNPGGGTSGLTYRWTVKNLSGATEVIGTSPTVTWQTPHFSCCSFASTVTFTATNAAGESSSKSVDVDFYFIQ